MMTAEKSDMSRPLARELLLLVLASAVPAAAVAAAMAASLYEPAWQNGLMLVLGATALAAGIYVSCLIARGLANALADLAADARMLARGVPLARLELQVREFSAIADALAAAAARHRPQEPLRLDLGEGAQKWSHAVAARYRGGDMETQAAAPAPELSTPAAVLTRLARGFAPGAAAAGVALDFDVAPGLPSVRGSEHDLEAALFGLVDAALAVTARGGRLALSARALADGAVKIALGMTSPTSEGAPSLADAGGMIELSCGVALAASLARARALLAAAGGELAPGRGTITLLLAPAASLARAA
ncbi:MAG TPA: hypothetical protein VLV50_16415 [Stellaceae bacterium]|nr:hypothetical protein [Stellaceae bacterium]